MNPDTWSKEAMDWWDMYQMGNRHAYGRDYVKAYECLEKAEKLIDGKILAPPGLTIARCCSTNDRGGIIRSPAPNEDMVFGSHYENTTEENEDATGLVFSNIREIDFTGYEFDPGYHRTNIDIDQEHLMFLSTGRVGSVSMYHLFEKADWLPYHTYLHNLSSADRIEMMCRHLNGVYGSKISELWAITRAAEWLGANNCEVPMVALNHMDTIFAPTFAQIHPKSKFVFLRRDPGKVFNSFYQKNQWNEENIQPVYYTLPFQWKKTDHSEIEKIAWYIKFTDVFCRSFGKSMGDRFIEISSDKLFAKDTEETEKFKEFTGIPLSINEIKEHFSKKINEKKHKHQKREDKTEEFYANYNAM